MVVTKLTGSQRAAKTSRVIVGADNLTFASWSANVTGEDFPTVNFESYDAATDQTYDEGILGPLTCEIKFGGDWDAGDNPYDDPPGLFPRDDLAGVQFQESRLDGVGWDFPYIRVRSAENGAEIKGKVLFSVGGKNQGPFTFPSGSI
jgi:hypothetical protein